MDSGDTVVAGLFGDAEQIWTSHFGTQETCPQHILTTWMNAILRQNPLHCNSVLLEQLDTGRMLQNKHYSGAIVHELDIVWSPHGRNV